MSILKDYNQKCLFCIVTFHIQKGVVNPESQICLVGDFNNWDIKSLPMIKQEDGGFSISVDLEKGKEYQFKYIVDGREWINETSSDRFVKNEFKGENSVLIT